MSKKMFGENRYPECQRADCSMNVGLKHNRVCTSLDETYEGYCPFFKTKEQVAEQKSRQIERYERLGLMPLLKKKKSYCKY